MNKNKIIHWFIIGTFVSLYFAVSLISMIHVISFFELSNPRWLAISLAISFEIGAAASLASIIVLEKMNKTIVWILFWTLTLIQAMGNSFYSFVNLHDFYGWVELFGLTEEEPLFQKRILSIISGAILPLVALGFIKSLIDYIKPSKEVDILLDEKPIFTPDNVLVEKKNEQKKQKRTVEEKIYDSMTDDDKQKILNYLEDKMSKIDDKNEEIQIEEQNKKIIEPKSIDIENVKQISNPPTGLKGSKWIGKNRPKSNPV